MKLLEFLEMCFFFQRVLKGKLKRIWLFQHDITHMIQTHKMMSWRQKLDTRAALHNRKKIIARIKMYNKRSRLFQESTNQLGKYAVQFWFLP